MSTTYSNHTRSVLGYFSQFEYPLTIDELHAFFPVKISRKKLIRITASMKKTRNIVFNDYYTLPPYSIFARKRQQREKISHKKEQKTRNFIRIIRYVPIIKLIGFTGSLAMKNARGKDDIDLFVITSKNRLYTARFILLVIAQFLGLRRLRGVKTARDLLCFNLFYDEKNIKVPKHKKNLYIAHEIVQMTPIMMQGRVYKKNSKFKMQNAKLQGAGNIYMKFIDANSWVFKYFPNAEDFINARLMKTKVVNENKNLKFITGILKPIFDLVEFSLRQFQLRMINKHKTTEYITDHQLWFFPDDYEKKLGKQFIE